MSGPIYWKIWNENHPYDMITKENGIGSGNSKYCIHHIDFNHFNNDPDNLIKMTNEEHNRLHSTENNPMAGISLYDKWLEKYGKNIADEKYDQWINKQSIINQGKNNGFYGKKHNEITKLKMKIDIIIYSKDRPAQLDLLLRSINKYFKNAGDIYVVYKASNQEYVMGYGKALNDDDLHYLYQNDFKTDVLTFLNLMKSEYVLGISDDCVFIDDCAIPNYSNFNHNEVALSLRLGRNINYCQPAKLEMETPNFKVFWELLQWDWTKSDSRGCWGYPHPVDSNIYDRKYITELLSKGNYNNPYEMENHLNTNRPTDKPCMLCYLNPKLISIVANTVIEGGENPNMGISTEELNNKWLSGYQIKMPEIDPKSLRQCHIEYKYEFEMSGQ